MRTALYVPTHGEFAEPSRLIMLAQAAEATGFDGFFLQDHLMLTPDAATPLADATVLLGALAQATHSLRLGALVTPLSRRRPWKLAKELTTLDHLSGGRMICGVGLGEPVEADFAPFGEATGATTRAERLDEGLSLLDGFLRGAVVSHEGNHFQVHAARLTPACMQTPRMPIWIGATAASRGSLHRAALWDGCLPIRLPAAATGAGAGTPRDCWLEPADFAAYVARVRALRGDSESHYDFLASGRTLGGDPDSATARLASYHDAGATWWLEWVPDRAGSFAETLAAVAHGAPQATPRAPSPTGELRAAIRQLRGEIAATSREDFAQITELQELVARLEHDFAGTLPAASLAQRMETLKSALTRLEFKHPRATAIVNDIAMMLGNLGI